jgi:hypothetical protein
MSQRCVQCNEEVDGRFCGNCGTEAVQIDSKPANIRDASRTTVQSSNATVVETTVETGVFPRVEINRNCFYMAGYPSGLGLKVFNPWSRRIRIKIGITQEFVQSLGAAEPRICSIEPRKSATVILRVKPLEAGHAPYQLTLRCELDDGCIVFTSDDQSLAVYEKTQSAQNLAVSISHSITSGGDMSAISNRSQSDIHDQLRDVVRSGMDVNDLLNKKWPEQWVAVELFFDADASTTTVDQFDVLDLGFEEKTPEPRPTSSAEELKQLLLQRLDDSGRVTAELKGEIERFVLTRGIASNVARQIVREVTIRKNGRDDPTVKADAEACEKASNVDEYIKSCGPTRSPAWKLAAESGSAYGQYLYGRWLENSPSAADQGTAAHWHRKAADQGYAQAQSRLGVFYLTGKEGADKNFALAMNWYLKAAEQGNAASQYILGLIYYNGKVVTQDFVQAVTWYRKAAEQGHAEAQLCLGICYDNGEGVSQDSSQAMAWYLKAAEQGDAVAQNHFGNCYYGGEGVTEDLSQAVAWYHKAAEQGYAEAQNNLGNCYHNGQGVSQDFAQAVSWYRKAAEQGNAEAQ